MTDEREETQEEYEERREHDMAMSEFADDFDADRVITTQSVFRIDRAVTGQVERPCGWGRLLSLANDVEAMVKERDELRAQVAALTAERDAALERARVTELVVHRSTLRRDMVEAAAFVREYYESHQATTEWPDMQKTRDLREEAEAVADAFEQAGGVE